MLYAAKGAFPAWHKTLDRANPRLVFYGTSPGQIGQWLYQNRGAKWSFWGSVHVFKGCYVKTKGSSTRMHSALSLLDQGWGVGTLGNPILGPIVEGGMLVTGAEQVRYFTAVIHRDVDANTASAAQPTVLRGQKSIQYIRSFTGSGGTKSSLSVHQIIGGASPGLIRGVAPRGHYTGGRKTRLKSIFG